MWTFHFISVKLHSSQISKSKLRLHLSLWIKRMSAASSAGLGKHDFPTGRERQKKGKKRQWKIEKTCFEESSCINEPLKLVIDLSGSIKMKPPQRDSSRRSFFVLWWELTGSTCCRGFSPGLITLLVEFCCTPGRKHEYRHAKQLLFSNHILSKGQFDILGNVLISFLAENRLILFSKSVRNGATGQLA